MTEPFDVFTVRDLRNRTGDLMRDAEEGRLSIITKHGRPAILAILSTSDCWRSASTARWQCISWKPGRPRSRRQPGWPTFRWNASWRCLPRLECRPSATPRTSSPARSRSRVEPHRVRDPCASAESQQV
jgi:prevent-host-death family protein